MSAIENAWQETVTAAVLGAARRPPPALPPGLPEAGPTLQPPRLLLRNAAILAHYRRCGQMPGKASLPAPATCPADELPPCSPNAAARLLTLTQSSYQELLSEWLNLAAARQKRLPPEHLPILLDWGEKHLAHIGPLLTVIGQRGRWLAAQNPAWEHIALTARMETLQPGDVQPIWQTGGRAARRYLLNNLRTVAPAAARDLLLTTWNEEPADYRADFLATFKNNLSMQDEPFLETVLDDRSAEVRQAAVDLLVCLADSRLVERQLQRALTYLQWKPGGFLRQPRLEISLPESCTPEMRRDGVRPDKTIRSFGPKAEWLYQILAAVPPSTWCRMWNQTPAGLLQVIEQEDWEDVCYEAWIVATLRHQDAAWAEAILPRDPLRSRLLDVLPPERQEPFLIAQCQARPMTGMHMLSGYACPWSETLSRLALTHLRPYCQADERLTTPGWLQEMFRSAGRYISPALPGDLVARLVGPIEPGSNWEEALNGLLDLLDFRRQMSEELNT